MRSNVVLLSPQGGIPASSVLRRVAIDPPDPTSETRVEGGRLQSLDTVAAALSMSSAGTLYQLVDLANEALALDPHLASIAVRRFGTVASAPWELAPAKGPDVDKELAKELAEEATAFLETLPGDSQGGPGGFTQLLLDIMWATYHGRAASELVWEDPSAGELASIEWIHPRRIALDRNRMPYVDPRLADPPMTGWYRPTGRDRELVSLCDPRTRGKFIYATSRYFAEHPEREGLAYRSIYWAAFKRFGMRERMVLAETYAKPYKVIEVAEGASVDPAVLEQVMQEVEAAGSSTSTVRMPKGLTLRIEWPQEVGSILTANTEAVNEELSKLWLGQTMTTTDGSSRAQAEVHERQQNLLAFLDAELAQRVITEQVLKPRALMRGGEKELRHCPRLRLRVGAQPDRLVESQVIEKAVSLGMQVSALEAHEKLGLRVPADGEEILGPPAQAAPALGPDGEPLPPGAPPPDGAPPAGPVTPPEDGPPAPGTPPPPKAGRKAEGGPPDGAVKAEAFGEAVALYDEDQPRDDGGRWTSGGGGGGAKPKVEAPARVRSDVTRAAQVARELAKGGRTSVSRADLVEGMGREPTNREWAAFRNEAKARQHLQVEAPEPKAAPAPPAPPAPEASGPAVPPQPPPPPPPGGAGGPPDRPEPPKVPDAPAMPEPIPRELPPEREWTGDPPKFRRNYGADEYGRRRPPSQVGKTFRVDGRPVTVVSESAHFYADDARSFGIDDEAGWAVWHTTRDASPEEVEQLRAREREEELGNANARARDAYDKAVREFPNRLREAGLDARWFDYNRGALDAVTKDASRESFNNRDRYQHGSTWSPIVFPSGARGWLQEESLYDSPTQIAFYGPAADLAAVGRAALEHDAARAGVSPEALEQRRAEERAAHEARMREAREIAARIEAENAARAQAARDEQAQRAAAWSAEAVATVEQATKDRAPSPWGSEFIPRSWFQKNQNDLAGARAAATQAVGAGLIVKAGVSVDGETVYARSPDAGGPKNAEELFYQRELERVQAANAEGAAKKWFADRKAEAEIFRGERKPEPGSGKWVGAGNALVEDRGERGLSVRFPSMPSQDARDQLKRAGFRWNPAEKAWTRARTDDALVAAKKAAGVKQLDASALAVFLSHVEAGAEAEASALLDGAEPVEALDLAAPVEWDEAKHPRDKGKFASAPGARGAPETPSADHRAGPPGEAGAPRAYNEMGRLVASAYTRKGDVAPAPPPEPDEKPAKGDLTAKKGKGEEGASPRPAVRAPYTLPPAERYGVKPEDLELPAGWATTEERATERQRELDEQRGGPAPTPKAVSGTMAEGARAVRDNARALLRSYRSTLSGEEYSAARDWVDDTAEAFGEAFPEAEAADVDAIMRDAVDRLMVQHYESERRALTDHGLRHILGDIDNGRQILDALEEGGTKIDKGDRLASSLALALHDYGYLAPTQRGTFKNDAHPALSARVYEADNREAFARVLGDQRADWITHAIATHPFAAVDWEADPLTSALRTADNLSIFAPQKLPTLFTAIEGAVTDLKAMRAAKTDASFEVIKTRLTDRVAKAQNVSERQRSQLQKALGEVSRFTPKVMLSRLAGDLDGFTFGGGVLDVGIRYTEAASAISEVFHDRNADFLKFASDLGAAKEDLTDPAKVAAGVDLQQGGRTVIRIHVNDLPANILDAGADEALELAETPAS